MKISVIIPFFNASEHLPACLGSLRDQISDQVELILVDNGSTDDSAYIVREFISSHSELPVTLYEERTRGASAARNKGAREARGQWLVFTDADCIADPNWLKDFKKHMQGDSTIGALAGCIRASQSEYIVAKFLGMFTLPENRLESIHREFTLVEGGFPSANMAVRKDVFNLVGGFDDGIPIYGEDHDLCARIYEAGFCIKSLKSAIVFHNHRTDVEGLIKQSFGFGKSHALSLSRSVPGAFIVEVPMIDFRRIRRGSRVWIDANQADKKMIAAILAGSVWTVFWFLPLAYYLYLCVSIFGHSRKTVTSIRAYDVPVCAGLLLLKSASMTMGRLVGSFQYGVFCI